MMIFGNGKETNRQKQVKEEMKAGEIKFKLTLFVKKDEGSI